MSIHDLLYQTRIQFKEKDLKPILDNLEESGVSKDDVIKFAEATGIDPNHIYKGDGYTVAHFYYNYPNYVEIFALDTESEFMIKDVSGRIKYQTEVFNNKEWIKYLLAVEGVMQMQIFFKIYPLIAPEERYELLRYMYVQNDQGHNFITKEMWIDALNAKPNKYIIEFPEEQDEYIIYRGVGDRSAKLNETLSWSLSYYVASKFAYNGDSDGSIHVAKVKKEDVIEYFDDRNEFEVIVQPDNIYDLKTYELYNPIRVYEELLAAKLIDEFNYYRNTFLKEENFKRESSIHGIDHSKRVLMFCLALSHYERLSVRERAMIANVALYHDIGRETDGVEPGHGVKSVNRLEEEEYPILIIDCQNAPNGDDYLLDWFADEELELIKTIIEAHDMDDEQIQEKIKEMPKEQQEPFNKLINFFKDADALDRIRLGDLDATYLRTEHAIHLTNFAWMIYKKL